MLPGALQNSCKKPSWICQLCLEPIPCRPHWGSRKGTKTCHEVVTSCKGMNYNQRLKFLDLPTLRYRRVRGDMIQVYKILHGIYEEATAPFLLKSNESRSRGNSLKLQHVYHKYDVAKYSFASRVVKIWNSLPDRVILATSVNSFKSNLDKYWSQLDFFYDYKGLLPGNLY